MDIQNFTDLQVWQRSMDLVVDVYRITEAYPRHELFVLTGQTHKSAISIPSNIAEGFCRARRSLPAYLNHLNIAMGSEGELYSQLEIGRRLKYATGKKLDKAFSDLNEIGRMLNGLIGSLELKQEQDARERKSPIVVWKDIGS